MATRKTAASRNGGASNRVTRSAAARYPTAIEPAPKVVTTEKSKTRKPLVNRNQAHALPSKNTKVKAPVQQKAEENDREPIKAFLRIRPNHDASEDTTTPYLKSLSETTVQMAELTGGHRMRLHPQSQVYTFNYVFPPETSQSEFFTKTSLPLVRDLLHGQNGLIFAYGVTNSGKTYTIQGGTEPDTAGLLPRTLDVVFNSLEGLHSNAPYRPVRISGIEQGTDNDPQYSLPQMSEEKEVASVLGEKGSQDVDSTTIKVDKNYEYSIWVSYAEVYNERVYDLLSDSDDPDGANGTPQKQDGSKRLPGLSSNTWSSLASLASMQSSDVLFVKRRALPLKKDPEGGGKYIAGLECVRVRTAEEAKRVFRMGNINRRVFGTLTNAVSSRSHGIFTIRAVRVHRADHSDVSVSRLSIVDLAGSERTKNTHTTGDRLKEAGSINKSLMVLGQCMEAMRSNQRRVAAMLAAPGRGMLDLSNPGRHGVKLAIIPFRHSKLTELFQDFFTGEQGGRAVMIVNVNPYDTGFDENSHVMRFAALAREVTTSPVPVVKVTIPRSQTPAEHIRPGSKANAPHHRNVTINTSGARKQSEAHIEVIEEDEESDGDGEPVDVLVDALFEELEDLRIKLYESEMRCAVIETETREEVMQEMESRMLDMERVFAKRLKQAVEQSEAKTDAKIDMLHQFGAFNKNTRKTSKTRADERSFNSVQSANTQTSVASSTSGSTRDVEDDDVSEDESSDDGSSVFSEHEDAETTYDSMLDDKRSSKVKGKFSHASAIGLMDEDMGIDEIDADETMTAGATTEDDGDDQTEGASDETEEDEEEWLPDPEPKPSPKRNGQGKFRAAYSDSKPRSGAKVGKLQTKMRELSLYADEDDDDCDEEIGEETPVTKGKRYATVSFRVQARICSSELNCKPNVKVSEDK